MKRKTIGFLLAALMLTALVVPASAAGTEMQDLAAGFYYESPTNTNLTVTAKDSSGNDVTAKMVKIPDGGTFKPYYPGSVKLSVTLNGTSAGQYAVYLIEGTTLPTNATPIKYIDQKEGGTSVSFTVYPVLPTETTEPTDTGKKATEMTLFITGNAAGFEMVSTPITFVKAGNYEVQLYTLGDVNDDGAIDTDDALEVLKGYVGLITLTDLQKMSANVFQRDFDDIDTDDALQILKYYVGLIQSFD